MHMQLKLLYYYFLLEILSISQWIQLPQQESIMSDYTYLYLKDKARLRENIEIMLKEIKLKEFFFI